MDEQVAGEQSEGGVSPHLVQQLQVEVSVEKAHEHLLEVSFHVALVELLLVCDVFAEGQIVPLLVVSYGRRVCEDQAIESIFEF